METYTITAAMLKSAQSKTYLYPGVTGPGQYTWNEAKHTYEPVAHITAHADRSIAFDDITSGLGIGGTGSDDYNMATEGDQMLPEYDRETHRPGQQVCPAGTTYGIRGDDNDRCVECGAPGDWNPGAGRVLCYRHWDEY